VQAAALTGWIIASAAFLSPLCALSVALFSARVSQHMVLILASAPLIAAALPRGRPHAYVPRLWIGAAVFSAALWFWHMPGPYEATFGPATVYWAMHVTLFGSAIFLWRELIDHPPPQTAQALAAGMTVFVLMGLLGAVIAFADRPMYLWHLFTTQPFGLTALQDQELGGTIMWVPAIGLFLWSALRSVGQALRSLERTRPA